MEQQIDRGRRETTKGAVGDSARCRREVLSQYLNDIYHEDATPTNGDIFEAFSASV